MRPALQLRALTEHRPCISRLTRHDLGGSLGSSIGGAGSIRRDDGRKEIDSWLSIWYTLKRFAVDPQRSFLSVYVYADRSAGRRFVPLDHTGLFPSSPCDRLLEFLDRLCARLERRDWRDSFSRLHGRGRGLSDIQRTACCRVDAAPKFSLRSTLG
jgi:hypothetical protein